MRAPVTRCENHSVETGWTARETNRPSSAHPAIQAPQSLQSQRQLVEGWLQSAEALHYAKRLTHRHRLRRSGEEVVSEAWIRMQGTFSRRSEPYPDLGSRESAQRFVARVLDTMCRDMARLQWKRDAQQAADAFEQGHTPHSTSDGKLLIEQLLFAVGRRARHGVQCSGCHDEVVIAASLELLHLLLIEHDGSMSGNTLLDRLLYEALDRVTLEHSLAEDARRQRKARCGKCIVAMIESGLRDMGVER